ERDAPFHAAGNVEQQRRRERCGLFAEARNGLLAAVLKDFKVGLLQPVRVLAALIRDRHIEHHQIAIDAHHFVILLRVSMCASGWYERNERQQADRREQPEWLKACVSTFWDHLSALALLHEIPDDANQLKQFVGLVNDASGDNLSGRLLDAFM